MTEQWITAPTRRVAAVPAPHTRRDTVRDRLGDLIDGARLMVNAQVTRRHPVSLVHFVTRRCNARCSFCFIDFEDPVPRSQEMTLDEIDRMTRTLGPTLANVNLTGGEPFLRRDLVEVTRRYYMNAGVRSVYVTTNGTFTERTESFAHSLAAEFPDRMTIVSLSVDGIAEEHDRIRRVDGLFDRAINTYHAVDAVGHGVMANVAITVSHENYPTIPDLYEALVHHHGVRSVSAIIVRDEGVHEVPEDARVGVLESYRWLTSRIVADQRAGTVHGYDPSTIQGRLMNRKNAILYDIIEDIYLDPHFVSPCRAAALFGVVDVDGCVYPCEVLEAPLGNLRDHDMDFSALWAASPASDARQLIVDGKCHCSYECAWGFNILGNARYQPRLLSAVLRA